MNNLVAYIVKGLVEHPDQVHVDEKVMGKKAAITITVAEDDRGRIIGRGGRVIKAIRMLSSVAAANKNLHVSIELQ
jgi:uncharacterized protein